jgi:hypothetical protein
VFGYVCGHSSGFISLGAAPDVRQPTNPVGLHARLKNPGRRTGEREQKGYRGKERNWYFPVRNLPQSSVNGPLKKYEELKLGRRETKESKRDDRVSVIGDGPSAAGGITT